MSKFLKKYCFWFILLICSGICDEFSIKLSQKAMGKVKEIYFPFLLDAIQKIKIHDIKKAFSFAEFQLQNLKITPDNLEPYNAFFLLQNGMLFIGINNLNLNVDGNIIAKALFTFHRNFNLLLEQISLQIDLKLLKNQNNKLKLKVIATHFRFENISLKIEKNGFFSDFIDIILKYFKEKIERIIKKKLKHELIKWTNKILKKIPYSFNYKNPLMPINFKYYLLNNPKIENESIYLKFIFFLNKEDENSWRRNKRKNTKK